MKWVTRGILAALVVAAGLGVWIATRIDAAKITRIAELRFELATGRDVSMSGPSAVVFWPTPGVQTGSMAIRNPDWARAPHLIEAEGLLISLDWWDLLTGNLRPGHVTMDQAQISVELQPDGTSNWALPQNTTDTMQIALTAADADLTLYAPRLGLEGVLPAIEAQLSLAPASRDRTEVALSFGSGGDMLSYRAFVANGTGTGAIDGDMAVRLSKPVAWLDRLNSPLADGVGRLGGLEAEARIETGPERMRIGARWTADQNGRMLTTDMIARATAGWSDVRDGTQPVLLDLTTRGGGVFSAYLNGPLTLGDSLTGEVSLAVVDPAGFASMFGLDVPDAMAGLTRALLNGRVDASPQHIDVFADSMQLDGPDPGTPVPVSTTGGEGSRGDPARFEIRDEAVLGGAVTASLHLPGQDAPARTGAPSQTDAAPVPDEDPAPEQTEAPPQLPEETDPTGAPPAVIETARTTPPVEVPIEVPQPGPEPAIAANDDPADVPEAVRPAEAPELPVSDPADAGSPLPVPRPVRTIGN